MTFSRVSRLTSKSFFLGPSSLRKAFFMEDDLEWMDNLKDHCVQHQYYSPSPFFNFCTSSSSRGNSWTIKCSTRWNHTRSILICNLGWTASCYKYCRADECTTNTMITYRRQCIHSQSGSLHTPHPIRVIGRSVIEHLLPRTMIHTSWFNKRWYWTNTNYPRYLQSSYEPWVPTLLVPNVRGSASEAMASRSPWPPPWRLSKWTSWLCWGPVRTGI